jgi:hypothetical protein
MRMQTYATIGLVMTHGQAPDQSKVKRSESFRRCRTAAKCSCRWPTPSTTGRCRDDAAREPYTSDFYM